MPGCTDERIDEAEHRLGMALPDWLRRLYAEADGRWADPGQWWVVWPLADVVSRTIEAWDSYGLDPALVAFGDDGCGDPFCVDSTVADTVVRWSMVDGGRVEAVGVDEFTSSWLKLS